MAKPGAVHCQKEGAVVLQLVPKLKESVPPPPWGGVEGVGSLSLDQALWELSEVSIF